MSSKTSIRQSPLVVALTLAALGLLAVIYYSPIWWVSLTAPNYPEESFPDGVRIHFHMNGVFNGCKLLQKDEITEDEALDCVHEMDTINHYVGMYPIAAGGPIERGFSQFLVAFLGVMLLGFLCTKPKMRVGILAVGFSVIAVWMYMTFYTGNGFRLMNEGYIEAMMSSLDQEAGKKQEPEIVIGGIVGSLRQSLEDSGVDVELPSEQTKAKHSDKQALLHDLRETFERDQTRTSESEPWNGSTAQILIWHYEKSLGRWFNNPEEINPMVKTMTLAMHLVFAGILIAMVVLTIGSYKTGGLFYWLLVVVPLALPVFFIIEYSAWLWWYGHTLNDMGAFTVKPFMPTVFGQGKVAQFSTHSYPAMGFGLMLLMSVLLAVAALLRLKQTKQA
ncbi:MAG: hypothetical protein H7842_11245 [Gammaproteobacteria bacterium SHHR-1]|uniref:hypothetical protein n=1 Tax=Magnetovirga frankeli TaxID=947516 RepID=UPI001292E78F|nr:hypothetical protein D5125_01750 [gamma proteobacterium SS-5]